MKRGIDGRIVGTLGILKIIEIFRIKKLPVDISRRFFVIGEVLTF